MRVEIKSYSTMTSLISSIIFFVIGVLLFTNSDTIIKFLSYTVGGILVIYGIIKLITYLKNKKQEVEVTNNNLILTQAITFMILGIVCIFLAGVIETAFRLIIGAWILFSGINRLISALTRTDLKGKRNIVLIITASLLIIVGLYVLLKSNLLFKGIGILIMIYSAIDIISYIFTQAGRYEESSASPVIIDYEEKKTTKEKKKRKKKDSESEKETK